MVPANDSLHDQHAERFLRLVQERQRGRLKIYLGLAAGVGKTFRMLQEAHELLAHGVNVLVGYVETHGRTDTVAQLAGLPVLPRKSVFYKGRALEEMDLDGILKQRPAVVMVDELAHSNVPGSRHEKRWQDVKLNQVKSNFLATVSHELTPPLASTNMSLRVLAADRVAADERQQVLDGIRRETQCLLRIVEELLDVSRLDMGEGIQLNFAATSLLAVI